VSRLQRNAEGFLSLIGNKIGGREPTVIADTVVAGVDMTQLLMGRLLAVEQDVLATSAYGDTIELEVPDGEVWLLQGVSWAVLTVAAANRTNIHVYLTNLPSSPTPTDQAIILAGEYPAAGSTVIHTLSRERVFDRPFVLTAGCKIGYEVIDTTHVGLSWNGKAAIYRLSA